MEWENISNINETTEAKDRPDIFTEKRSHIRAKQLVALECDKITDAQYATAN